MGKQWLKQQIQQLLHCIYFLRIPSGKLFAAMTNPNRMHTKMDAKFKIRNSHYILQKVKIILTAGNINSSEIGLTRLSDLMMPQQGFPFLFSKIKHGLI